MHAGEWWFVVIDIVEVLTGSSIPKRYWSDLKRKLAKEGYAELYDKIVQLKFAASDRDRDAKGFEPLKQDAQEGGAVAGSTRRDIEKRSGQPVVTGENFKGLAGKERKRLRD